LIYVLYCYLFYVLYCYCIVFVVRLCLYLWCVGAYSTATVFGCHSSAVYSSRPEFVALKIVRSLASQAEVCPVFDCCACSFCCGVYTDLTVRGISHLVVHGTSGSTNCKMILRFPLDTSRCILSADKAICTYLCSDAQALTGYAAMVVMWILMLDELHKSWSCLFLRVTWQFRKG